MLKKFFILACCIIASATVHAQEDGWTELFNGKDFGGWKILNGTAEYTIEEGGIICGTSKLGTPNTFLSTDKTYSDFILEVEVLVDARLNSGIQFRSLSTKKYNDGRVHGYQCEIDPSARAWSGGIYDEARRGWLYPLTRNPKGQKAFKVDGWNKYRIEAIGSEIRTWLNGVQCSNLVDNMTSEGLIALQVHGIWGDKSKEGAQVRWRNIRIKTTNLEQERWQTQPNAKVVNYIPNSLCQQEKQEGWRLLWDGKTTDGWIGAKLDKFPDSGWYIKDGVLGVEASGGGESTNGGDIVTTEDYSNFVLQVDFKLSEGANSGVKYFVDPQINKGAGSAIGLEFQILDNKKHPDAKKGMAGNRTLGSLYDLITATNLSEGGSNLRFKGVGQWNRAMIVVRDGKVEHWLNDVKVVEFDRFSQIFGALVAYSKYKDWEGFGQWDKGPILLQDHGDKVEFRSIKIKVL
ncbi:MAG: DUF1080 domain-containing protein [Bacteroidales bacterium]